jgi:Zn-dependent protease with chaperone function
MKTDEIIGYYQVSKKENIYYAIRLVISVLLYIILLSLFVFAIYNNATLVYLQSIFIAQILTFLILYYIFKNGIFIGFFQCYSIKINERQLPEIYDIVKKCAGSLNIKNIPKVYLFEAGGTLNAFAKKFFFSNYIVLYSDLLDAYYQGEKDSVEFVIAHEMGHIKRNHFWKRMLLAPSGLIPFLAAAYNRGCELTCDNIGKFFNKSGAINGILLLSGGKTIFKEINLSEFMKQADSDEVFWRWLAEKFLSHPALCKRMVNIYETGINQKENFSDNIIKIEQEKGDRKIEDVDHSRFMPKF